MDRFHIVVFNYEHIDLFLDNFHKVLHFNKKKDKIYIFDCSQNFENQHKKIIEFCKLHRFALGIDLVHMRRKNWGIDQGARIDYLFRLKKSTCEYIWQFQEHYLDNTSAYSRWRVGKRNLSGNDIGELLKDDVLPLNSTIDLDTCERAFQNDSRIGCIYANIGGIGIFHNSKNSYWLYTDGANGCWRRHVLLKVISRKQIETYKTLFDDSYSWSLFVELDIYRSLFERGYVFYDLLSHQSVSRGQLKRFSHHPAEIEYRPIYARYRSMYSTYVGKLWCFHAIQRFINRTIRLYQRIHS